MKTLESIKQYSPCQCEGGGANRELGNNGIIIPIPVEGRKTAGGTINDPSNGGSHAYSSDNIRNGSITFTIIS
jgi:hypothetical protein